MSKPPRTRPNPTEHPARKAPTYSRLNPDRYAQLDTTEQRRHDAHLDIDAIHDAIQYAELDRRAHGWPSNLRPTDGSRSTDEGALNPVESWSQKADPASEWLAEYAEMRAHLTRLANLARYHYGYDPDRGHADEKNLTPRPRGQQVEICVWCTDPAPPGRDSTGQPLLRRVDGHPIHASPCYWTAATAARRAGVSIAAHIAAAGMNNEQRGRSAS
jgi:hypothetical protein